MPTGSAAFPWWVEALLLLMAVVIVVTLIVLVAEMIRNIGAGKKSQPQPVDQS
jgi:hypothetical protein